MTPDEELMAAVQDGDEQAFTALVRRYERPLYGYLRRLVRSNADAEDLFQEAFLRVYAHRRRYKRGRPFRPWLYRIATNLARDGQRYRARHPETPLEAALDNLGHGDRAAAPGGNPVEHSMAHETEARLEKALNALPLKQRSVFVMARYQGMEYGEIANTLQIPVGTVKSRMNKAVNALLSAIRDDG